MKLQVCCLLGCLHTVLLYIMSRNSEKSQLIVSSCEDGGPDPDVCSSGYISSLTVVTASGEVHVP